VGGIELVEPPHRREAVLAVHDVEFRAWFWLEHEENELAEVAVFIGSGLVAQVCGYPLRDDVFVHASVRAHALELALALTTTWSRLLWDYYAFD